MASDLEQAIHELPTPELLERVYRNRDEYAAEALQLMEREIARRGVSEDETRPYEQAAAEDAAPLRIDDFVKFDHTFSQTDLLLAVAVLRDAEIPHFIDNPDSSVIPLMSGAERRLNLRVHKAHAERAHELLDQHFHRDEGEYRLRHTDVRDRLRGFSFSEVQLSEAKLEEEVDLILSPEESESITRLGRRLLDEIEKVEREQERVVFHYDNVEPMIERIGVDGGKLRVVDLLTVIEVLQIYVDDPAFQPFLLESAAALLEVFDRA